MEVIIIVIAILWIVYQFGKISERVQNDEKEAREMIKGLRERLKHGEAGFKSFSDAYSTVLLPGVSRDWSPTLRKKFYELLADEVRAEKKSEDISRAVLKARELIRAVHNGSSEYKNLEEMYLAIQADRYKEKYAGFSETYMSTLIAEIILENCK